MKAHITFKDEENAKKYFEELKKPMSDRTNDESGNRYFYSLLINKNERESEDVKPFAARTDNEVNITFK